MQYVTIKDIARELCVSVATVSRAFNDKYDIRKETRELILLKAKEMGYRPNPMARKLLQKHSFNIGVIVPEFINSFFSEVITGIQQVFREKGYQVIIMQSNECAETELENLILMEDNMVDGVLLSLTKETKNLAHLEKLIRDKYPIVLFNRINESLALPKVVFNDYKWALFATEHLIEQGCRKIIHLAGPKHLILSKNRIRGFERALEKHHIPFHKSHVIETGFFIEDGERVMDHLLQQGNVPDGIFATNDPTAIGAMKVLKSRGYRIPEDIAVVGFSNAKMAEIVEPSLSSVQQPTVEMGKTAARLLLEQLLTKEVRTAETIVMEGKLIIRNSSMKIKN